MPQLIPFNHILLHKNVGLPFWTGLSENPPSFTERKKNSSQVSARNERFQRSRARINSFLSIQFNSNPSWILDFSIQFNSNSNQMQNISIQFQFNSFSFNSVQILCTVKKIDKITGYFKFNLNISLFAAANKDMFKLNLKYPVILSKCMIQDHNKNRINKSALVQVLG